MKNKILKWLKAAGFSFLWICSGLVLFAIFFGILWISDGSYAGYPALIVVTIFFIFLAVFILKEQSTIGKVLRLIPISLTLLISFWCMIPIASDAFEPIPDYPGTEIWDLGNDRSVSLSHHTPDSNTSLKSTAILFVHGGPGAYVRDFDRSLFAGFSDLGYDVFIYDQVGAGRSPVVDVETYTHQNNVEDLANRFIRNSFMEEETPDLSDLGIPVMLLLGECSNIPRGYAMDYFDVYSISRSHAISGVGHILWGNQKGEELTREAIMSFLNDSEMSLPNEPDKDSRNEFIEQGK